jgi:hypothetical protein
VTIEHRRYSVYIGHGASTTKGTCVVVKVIAEMPATVWKVLVEVGQSVTLGQELFILESMKMEIPVESPCDGVVETVHVAAEESLQEGQLLLELRRNG